MTQPEGEGICRDLQGFEVEADKDIFGSHPGSTSALLAVFGVAVRMDGWMFALLCWQLRDGRPVSIWNLYHSYL